MSAFHYPARSGIFWASLFLVCVLLGRASAIDTGCAGDGSNTTVVAEYIFHEGGGTNVFNTGTDGPAGDAILVNGVSFSTDVPPANAGCGYSINLPATGTGSTTPAVQTASSYDPLKGATNFTIMGWVKRQSASTASNQSARIVSDTSSLTLTSTTAGIEFRFSGSAGTLAVRVNGNELSTTVGGIAPNEGNWHHVAVVYDGTRPATNTLSRNIHFYVDSVQCGDGNTLTNVIIGANTNRLTIGNSSVSRGVDNTLVGKMDDVRLLRGFALAAVGNGKTNTTILCYLNRKDDFEAPTISCPPSVTTNTDNGHCYATGVALGSPITSDNCNSASVTNNAPDTFPMGLTLVLWTATDLNGNSSTCTQQVTVIDYEPPTITCPAAVTVNTDPGHCTATDVTLGTPVTSDNCAVVSIANTAPASFSVGTTSVTWTVTDSSGNSATCQQSVTVVDSQTPVITCPPTVMVGADAGQCYASGVSLGTTTITENCAVANITNNAPATFALGTNIVTWTVRDTHGNTNTCSQLVIVANAPTISCGSAATLQNPGFESGDSPPGHALTGWTNFGDNGPNVYRETNYPHSGAHHLKLFGSFMTATNLTGVYQDLLASPGQTWRAGAYVATSSSDPILSGSRARVQLEFFDAAFNSLASANNSADFTVDDLPDTYRPLSVTATAPAGTAYARIVCVYEQRWHTAGSVYFDDASLSILIESADNNCQAMVPGLGSLAVIPTNCCSALSQTPPPGTRVGSGTTNVTLMATNATGQSTGCVFPLTVVDDTAPKVTGPSPMLVNSSFEIGGGPHSELINGWTGYGTPDTNMVNVSQVPYVPRSGAFVAKLFQEWSAATNYTGLYQELPASTGETWQASVYIWLPVDDPIVGANRARVQLEFYSNSHALLAQFSSADLTAFSPKDQWTLVSAWGTAPAGTAYARLVCLFIGDRVSTGSEYFDDASLSKIVLPIGSCQTAILPNLTTGSTATDNCGGSLTVSQSPAAGSALALGLTTVTLTATDAVGNVGHYRVDVLVIDTNALAMAFTAPDTVCPYAPSNTASVATVSGASYHWTIDNGSITSGQGTHAIVWQAGALGWSVLNVSVTPASGCVYTNSKAVPLECASGLLDSDGDGIPDYEEINLYHTNPNAVSTDGSGISDYEEIFLALVNPLATNFDGTVTDAVIKNGADISGYLGSWQVDGAEIYAVDRRGYVEYSVTVSAADVYRVVVEGREQNFAQTNSSAFDLQVYVDGEYLGRQTLQATTTTYGTIHLYSPYLKAGTHTVRVFWDNAASNTSLQLKDVRLQILGGPDTNGNGIKDWVEARMHAMSGLDTNAPVASYTSPACVEGRDRYLSMMAIQSSLPSGALTNIVPNHNAAYRWYADVPLSSTNSTQVVASFQNGGLVQTQQITWVARNILDGGTATIRSGDSLLLTAAPEGATNGTVNITILSGANTIAQYSTTWSNPVAVPFTASGTFTVTGVYTPASGSSEGGSMTVDVQGFSFSSNPAVWVEKTRNWSTPASDAVFNADLRLLMLAVGAPTNNPRIFSLTTDENEPRYVVTRTVTNGPILNAARADGFRLFTTIETYNKIVQKYPDGSQLVETMEVLSPVLPNVTIQIFILVGGVTFDDGTTYKELTAGDFDSLGQCKLRFLMPAGVETANCHRIKIVQGTDLVGIHY